MSIFKTPTPPYRTKSGPVISPAPADERRDVCDWVRGLLRTETPAYRPPPTRTDPKPEPPPSAASAAPAPPAARTERYA